MFRALLHLPGIRTRLAKVAGQDALDDSAIDRLAYLVFLHDCGKVNSGFQARIDLEASVVGHIAPMAAICGRRAEPIVSERALTALAADRLESWGPAITPLFDAILSHHGRPWPRDDDGRLLAKHWRVLDGYDPVAELASLRADADARFAAAHVADASPLPSTNEFVHGIAGLVQLADWIGSSGWTRDRIAMPANDWSSQTLREIGLDPSPYRSALDSSADFVKVFGRTPYPHQTACGDGTAQLMILEAETGSGKTEAALWRFHQLFLNDCVDGMYFALPTRTAAAQLHRRVQEVVKRLWGENAPPTVMAVPGYLDDQPRGGLPAAADAHDGPERDTRSRPVWAAEHPKRFFSAMIGVGTIDQALMAALRVKHAHLRASCLMRQLLVVDEVHASDPYMQRLLEQLLQDHIAAGGYALLLSATLGAEARRSLMEAASGGRPRDLARISLHDAQQTAYPLLSVDGRQQVPLEPDATLQSKCVQIHAESLLDDPVRVARLALESASAGAKVLIVRNTVAGAVAMQRALETDVSVDRSLLFTVAGQTTLHHGRFAREDRRLLDGAVEGCIGRMRPGGGLVIVGTQTLEQSLDIDADLLITDLCPVDVLLQRIGRLHRHLTDGEGAARVRTVSFASPTCIVLTPVNGLADFLPSRRVGGGDRHGLGHSLAQGIVRGVYADLSILEATRRLIVENPVWTIPTMNRWLVESGIHTEALDALVETMSEEEREKWRHNRQRVEGDELAQVGTAAGSILRKNRDFMEQGLDDGERITTRLGADDRLLQLPPNTVGPFGIVISQLAVPSWMLLGVDADAEPVLAERSSGTHFEFTVGERRFVYSAHGLHQMATLS